MARPFSTKYRNISEMTNVDMICGRNSTTRKKPCNGTFLYMKKEKIRLSGIPMTSPQKYSQNELVKARRIA